MIYRHMSNKSKDNEDKGLRQWIRFFPLSVTLKLKAKRNTYIHVKIFKNKDIMGHTICH